ncbi:hypothetical protein SAMN05444162_1526 [Paenibacillaceae bacterium GAS479]|nr:hypothetical protein SAMN05444162_1526 [Paenibacillaceae bacterium GAS479]
MSLRKSALIMAGLSALVIFGILVKNQSMQNDLPPKTTADQTVKSNQNLENKSNIFQSENNQTPSPVVRGREIDKALIVQERKAESLELQVKEQARLLEAKQNQIKQLNIARNIVQSMRNDLPPNATADTAVKPNQNLTNALIAAGIPVQEPKNKAELDALNQLIESKIQTLSSSVQTGNLKIQSAMKQWNNAVKYMSDLMKTRKSINDSIKQSLTP